MILWNGKLDLDETLAPLVQWLMTYDCWPIGSSKVKNKDVEAIFQHFKVE